MLMQVVTVTLHHSTRRARVGRHATCPVASGCAAAAVPQMRAFTLLETAVVLVIIALIAGAILIGADLLHQSALRSLVGQLERYDAAVLTFRGKYGGMPGDYAAAVEAGLGDASCPVAYECDPEQPASYAYAGCPGNGDQRLDDGGGVTILQYCPEHLNFWYHMRQAGLVKDLLDGRTINAAANPLNRTPVFGVSAPSTAVRDVGIRVHTPNPSSVRNVYYIGWSDASVPQADLLPAEAYYIDAKLDDALPASGSVQIRLFSGACLALESHLVYNVDDAQARCAIMRDIGGYAR